MNTELQVRILDSVFERFDKPLIQNNLRGLYVEHMVALLLGSGWNMVSADWAPWDVEHMDGIRLEVKQSAAKQTWTSEDLKPQRNPRFSIRAPKGSYEGKDWIVSSGRLADMYVFAWHATADQSADHRNPEQWMFYVVKSEALPNQGTIGLSSVKGIAAPLRSDELRDAVEKVRQTFERRTRQNKALLV